MKKLGTILLVVSFAITMSAQIALPLVDSFSGGNDVSVGPGTAGLSFTVGAAPLTVEALGVFDTSGTGLNNSHEVGIWDTTTSHNLLGSVNIPASGAFQQNNFFYENLGAPITLQANTTYVIAAQYKDADFDLARANANTLTMNGATYGHAVLSSTSGFDYPDTTIAGADFGFFGPNASFAAVPEPAATAIVTAAGLALMAAIRRWKARQATGAATAS